jgi:integrase
MQRATTITFKEAAEKFFVRNAETWRNPKHRQQWQNTLKKYAYPVLGKLAVADIDTRLVLRVLEPIWNSKTETASRVRGRIERVLDWAAVNRYRPRGDNPAAWGGVLEHALAKRSQVAKVVHHRALPWSEVPAFMAQVAQREGVAAQALAFTVLTACRTNEVIGARWSEVDLEAGLWVIPAQRMKAQREHRVPLSEQALAILQALPRETEDGYLFVGARRGQSLSNMAMAETLKRMEIDATVHGFRSSFRDWAGEHTNFPREIAEAALAHALRDKVEAAYRRGDALAHRAQLMQAWATFCTSPAPAGDVVPIRSGSQR